jgi:hypothetical protein
VQIDIGTSSFGTDGGTVTALTTNFDDQGTNQFGFDVGILTATVSTGLSCPGGTCWLTLSNASVTFGDPVYWDENSGPSQAYESSVGSIPSEAFTVTGNSGPPQPSCFVADLFMRIIHDFTHDDPAPEGVTIDKAGNLYGTADTYNGVGMVYRLAPKGQDWLFTPLYSFIGGYDGGNPSPVIVGPDGGLYGTANGGLKTCGSSGDSYCGLVFRLSTPSHVVCSTALCSWTEEVLYRFTGSSDGWNPTGDLAFDAAGNLYGIASSVTGDIIYELTPSIGGWTEKVIYSFTGGTDGSRVTSLLAGKDGDLYGTTDDGGGDPNCAWGCGSVFQLVPSGGRWTKNIIYAFHRQNDGVGPSGLRQDSSGKLYGVSWVVVDCVYSYKIIFGLSPSDGDWVFGVLYSSDGGYGSLVNIPNMTTDAAGNFFFTEDVWDYDIYAEAGVGVDGYVPWWTRNWFVPTGPLAVDSGGILYGTTPDCGKYGNGTVWMF